MKAPVGLLSRRPVCEANAACLARQGHSDFEAREAGVDCSLLAPKENQKSASDFDALDPRIKGCSPLIIPKQKSKRKNASRFAKRIFRASPIRRPLSRCGGSSPQGSERQQMQFIATTPSREKVTPKSPRLRSNESPSGAFKRQNGLALARWRGFAPTSSAGFSELLIIKIFFPLKMPRAARRAF